MNGKVITVVVAVLLIAGGVVLAVSSKKDDTIASTTQSTSQPGSSTTDQTTSANTITYSDNGFSPASLTVAAGTKITIKNISSNALQFNSNPHPQHTDDSELNVGSIEAGSSKTITVTKTGSHGYHNHLNTGDTGTIVVQ